MTRGLQALCIAGLVFSLVVQIVGLHGAPWLTPGVMVTFIAVGFLLFFVCCAFHPEAKVTSDPTSTTIELSVWRAVRVCPSWLQVSLVVFCAAELLFLVRLWASLGLGPGDELNGFAPPAPAFWAAIMAWFYAIGFCLLDTRRRLNPFAP